MAPAGTPPLPLDGSPELTGVSRVGLGLQGLWDSWSHEDVLPLGLPSWPQAFGNTPAALPR